MVVITRMTITYNTVVYLKFLQSYLSEGMGRTYKTLQVSHFSRPRDKKD